MEWEEPEAQVEMVLLAERSRKQFPAGFFVTLAKPHRDVKHEKTTTYLPATQQGED